MVENEVSVNGRFSMKINFNLKGIGSKKSQIWLTTTINKERVRIYTGLLIEPEYWIKTTRTQVGERASEDSALGNVQLKYNKGVNKGLKKILDNCHEYGVEVSQNHLMNNGMEHNAKNFSDYINAKIRGVEVSIRKKPAEFINAYIERKSQMVNRDTQRRIVSGTIYNHRNALQRLQKFCEDKHIRLVWEVFNAQLEERFTAWMMSKNYTSNTIAAQYSIMKVWLTEAEIQGLITDKSFHRYQTKCHDVENVYLTEEDINKLYAIDFNDEVIKTQIDPRDHIEITRDLFIVACWTGLRFGDWKDLSEANINDDTMIVHTHKTDKTVIIPLHPMVKAIIAKYGGVLPKSVDKSKTLKHIRKCAEWAGISEPVSLSRVKGGQTEIKNGAKHDFLMNHTARRSFATNMYLKGVPTISIMAITGHTTEGNFLKYIKVDKLQHARIVAQAFAQ
ncbi:MAG: site-specific integrase [Bacteroidaceae bacterium]|nr:site-specific integrase [Bacteroidaceae bacterium]